MSSQHTELPETPDSGQESGQSRKSGDFPASKLNAEAPAFVPSMNSSPFWHGSSSRHLMPQVHHRQVLPFHPVHAHHGHFPYFGYGDQEHAGMATDPDPNPSKEVISEELSNKVVKQVEYYFRDANLATGDHLMKFVNKDSGGFVPISVIASFKKIKALISNHAMLADALRTSKKLVVSEDGKKVKRLHPLTESDIEDLQSRTVVVENLPEDHSHPNLEKIFSVVGSVKTIRICHPQGANGTASSAARSPKMDMLVSNKLHAFVEYETVEQAEKAVAELNDERNWRSGLRVRLLLRHTAKSEKPGRAKRADGNGEEDEASTSELLSEKHVDDQSPSPELSNDSIGDEGSHEREGGGRRSRGRGRGKARARGQHPNGWGTTMHSVGTPPTSSNNNHALTMPPPEPKHPPPGPRMPDGTRGFTMGRGKPMEIATQ
ncbi:la-related protein 6B [Amborella trichopoda]|uniref:HTH La-type RNA-binding domain-containing protein n=1 Tax=Amborella trichopoda TaxID=13333 RepID=U5DFH0_AMBTC|nr:la-related protein 6B [Amborella trichopoda]XP_020532011.1 la-related protein 6B [Amborella trichopoda]ERN20202.1 hypothetical protein AMTR_s00066p00125170 [Amborella trichopoda]|eukprot:XP_006858735.1 la-related protein 6B [Amborella trichopoda]